MVFADISRAFDSVDRTKLIEKLRVKCISHYLIKAIADLLSNTTHHLTEEDYTYHTTIGVP